MRAACTHWLQIQSPVPALAPAARHAHHPCLAGFSSRSLTQGFEVVKAVHVSGELFSVDNNLLTPTFKLKRAPLLKHFQAEVDAMYAALKNPRRALGWSESMLPAGGGAGSSRREARGAASFAAARPGKEPADAPAPA
jgi:hypothetical protein